MRIFISLLAIAAAGFAAQPSNTSSNNLSATGRLAKRQVDSVNRGVGAQSGGCVNEPDCGEAALSAALLQSEAAIAVDSTGHHVVVGLNQFRGVTATTS